MPVYLLACGVGAAAFAATGGSIAGLVQDASGGVMSDVTVVARNPATGVDRKTVTNTAGFYAFPTLPSGGYELRIEHAGFKPFLQTGLDVTTNAALRVDIRLMVGAHSETVTVTESPT